jgi:hypothetical protein
VLKFSVAIPECEHLFEYPSGVGMRRPGAVGATGCRSWRPRRQADAPRGCEAAEDHREVAGVDDTRTTPRTRTGPEQGYRLGAVKCSPELVTAHVSETPPPSPWHRPRESDPILTSLARPFALPEEAEVARRVLTELQSDR